MPLGTNYTAGTVAHMTIGQGLSFFSLVRGVHSSAECRDYPLSWCLSLKQQCQRYSTKQKGLSKQSSQAVFPDRQNFSNTSLATNGAGVPKSQLISISNARITCLILGLESTASIPATTATHAIHFLSRGLETAFGRSENRQFLYFLTVLAREGVMSRTETLCNDEMQYRAIAAWYMLPSNTQSSRLEVLGSDQTSGENASMCSSRARAVDCVGSAGLIVLSLRRWLILIISKNRYGGQKRRGNMPSPYRSAAKRRMLS